MVADWTFHHEEDVAVLWLFTFILHSLLPILTLFACLFCSHSHSIHYCPSSPLLFILFTFTLHSPLAHLHLNCFFILIHIHISFTLCPSSLFTKQITNVLFLFFYSYSLNLPVTNRVVYGGPESPTFKQQATTDRDRSIDGYHITSLILLLRNPWRKEPEGNDLTTRNSTVEIVWPFNQKNSQQMQQQRICHRGHPKLAPINQVHRWWTTQGRLRRDP